MAKLAMILSVFVLCFMTERTSGYTWSYVKDVIGEYLGFDMCSEHVIAYYKFDKSIRDVCNGNNALRHGYGYPQVSMTTGVLDGAVYFTGFTELRVPTLNGKEWGKEFTVSIWFKTDRSRSAGLINNGAVYHGVSNNRAATIVGSWEIRLENSGTSYDTITAAIVTSNSMKSWKNITTAFAMHWHHFVMTYDGKTVSFYLNNHLALADSHCCHGTMKSSNYDVVIGHTGSNFTRELFEGYIDEVKILRKAVKRKDVTKLYRLKTI